MTDRPTTAAGRALLFSMERRRSYGTLEDILAIEAEARRATVERIRAAIRAKGHIGPEHGEAEMGANAVHFVVMAILDEEAKRA